MNITLSIDEEIVERVSKIAASKNTTLPAMVEDYLTSLADEEAASLSAEERKALADRYVESVEMHSRDMEPVDADRREAVARLEESIRRHSRDMGPRTWTRDDLYDRPKRYYQ